MFEPNSIRSLLKKRQQTRVTSAGSQKQQQTIGSTGDPDLDALLQTKLMIKEIDHQVDSIRQWRQHQKKLTQQKLKSNQNLAQFSRGQLKKYRDKQMDREKLQSLDIIKKMKKYVIEDDCEQQEEQAIQQQQRMFFQMISNTDQKVQYLKQNNVTPIAMDEHEAFVSSIQNLSDIFRPTYHIQSEKHETETKKIDQKALKADLDEIEKQLKQIEDILGD